MERGGVDEIELGAVDQHQRDRVAAADAQRGQPPGDPTHALRVLPVGDRHSITRCAKRDLVRALRRRQLKRLAERPCVQRRRARERLSSRALHRVPPHPGRVARAASVETRAIVSTPPPEGKVRFIYARCGAPSPAGGRQDGGCISQARQRPCRLDQRASPPSAPHGPPTAPAPGAHRSRPGSATPSLEGWLGVLEALDHLEDPCLGRPEFGRRLLS